MSDRPLPDKIEDWPVNIYDLFNIETNASERDLRRAYHRLIKIYRAEDHPEAFRKLTESYETSRQGIQYQQSIANQSSDDEAEEDWISASPTIWNDADVDTQNCSVIWEKAVEGDLSTSIDLIEKHCADHPADEESLLQLFWLKKIHDGHPPFEVLETYLARSGLTGRAFQLYLNELDRIPEAATRPSCQKLMLAAANDPRLPELTRLVWFLHYHQKKLGLIEQDFDLLRDQLVYDHPDIWKQLVHQAAEFLALAGLPKTNRLFQKVSDEVRLCESIPSAEWVESRWEMVRAISCDAAVPGTVPQDLLSLICDSLLQEEWELRHRLELIVLPWLTTPAIGLATLGRLKNWSSMGVFLFHRLASLSRADDYLHYAEGFQDQLRPSVIEFIRTVNIKKSEGLRVEVVRFCRQEDLSLELFLGAIHEAQRESQTLLVSDEIVRALNDDLPLKALIAAVRVFNE